MHRLSAFNLDPGLIVSGIAILAFTVAGFLALGASQAVASPVSCGDTITTDTTLQHDLIDCPNNGIVIGADGVTLDLNGHLIDGDSKPFSGCGQNEICDEGLINDGHGGVTVMHGSVRDFVAGVEVDRAIHNRILDVSASKNRFFGLVLFASARSLVRDSSGTGSNAPDHGTGLGLFSSHRVRILDNSFRHTTHHALVTVDSNNNLIKGNRFSGNEDEGILMEGGERNEITRNRLVHNGAGITLGPGSHNVITGNHVKRGRDGIRIEKGHGNLVADNVVVGTGQAGIRLGIHNPSLGGAHNVVRRNLVRDSRGDGFLVGKKDRRSLLKGNVAKEAGDDGFDVGSRTAKLTSNRAFRNGDLGIQAVRGVIDGGGNIARHNGDPRQCTNIACR